MCGFHIDFCWTALFWAPEVSWSCHGLRWGGLCIKWGWGEVGVGQDFSFGYVEFEVCIIHLRRDDQQSIGYASLEFGGEVWAGDLNLWAVSVWMGVCSCERVSTEPRTELRVLAYSNIKKFGRRGRISKRDWKEMASEGEGKTGECGVIGAKWRTCIRNQLCQMLRRVK